MVEQCQQLISLIKSQPLFKKKKVWESRFVSFFFFNLHLNLSILKNKTKQKTLLCFWAELFKSIQDSGIYILT